MAKLQIINNAVSRLSANISPTDTSISLLPGGGAKFPALAADEWFPATIVKVDGTLEVVRVIARATDVLTVVRGQESTAAISFNAGDRIELRFTANAFKEENARIEEIAQTGVDLSNALQLADYAALRAYTGSRKSVYVIGSPPAAAASDIAGMFILDDGDVTSADNGSTTIVSTNAKRWKRAGVSLQAGVGAVAQTAQTRFRERITPEGYGCTPGEANSTVNFRKALTAATGRTLWLEAGEYIMAPSEIPSGITIIGQGMRLTRIKMLGGSSSDLLYNLNARDIVLSNLTLDGNNGACANGRVLKIITNPASDGPALIMEDVALEFAPISGEDGQSSTFISGLAWVHMKNIRFVNNKASMWLSTVDSTFDNLFLGNTGVAAGLPGMIVGGSSNKFTTGYFGGNGADRGTGASQVKLLGASNNEFIGCTNDSANGHCYEFIDEGPNVCSYNRIIGGSATNASQNAHNTYQHIRYAGSSHHNTVIGTIIGSDYTVDPFLGGAPRRGNYAVSEIENANNNYHVNCPMLAFGTMAIATIGENGSRFIDCPGLNPQGPINVALTGSPMTYTNTHSVNEILHIAGGTVSLVTKNGVALSGATNSSVALAPTESVVITYSANPVLTADRR